MTELQFSRDDRYLLSVSRDRTWCLFRAAESGSKYRMPYLSEKTVSGGDTYGLLMSSDSCGLPFKHSRIIFACAWHQLSNAFVTVGRDKCLAVWSVTVDDANPVIHSGTFQASEPITAVDFSSLTVDSG